MKKSTALLALLASLTARVRAMGLTDSGWAARAGMPKETLSRLRRRETCDFRTLTALAEAVGARIDVRDAGGFSADADGHMVKDVDREYEERLAGLCASGDVNARRWSQFGPPFFMAGLAVMLASERVRDRRALLELAESLHPGASEPAVFARWLKSTPLRPSRFLPLVNAYGAQAA